MLLPLRWIDFAVGLLVVGMPCQLSELAIRRAGSNLLQLLQNVSMYSYELTSNDNLYFTMSTSAKKPRCYSTLRKGSGEEFMSETSLTIIGTYSHSQI